jgi:carbon catabolite-derepressing protein kinase
MDLQLYRIDDQNYLVDFRNLGYRPIRPSPQPPSSFTSPLITTASLQPSRDTSPAISLAASPLVGPGEAVPSSLSSSLSSTTANTADELRARRPELLGSRRASHAPSASASSADATKGARPGRGAQAAAPVEVNSPYLFLETAVALIVELASPSAAPAGDTPAAGGEAVKA